MLIFAGEIFHRLLYNPLSYRRSRRLNSTGFICRDCCAARFCICGAGDKRYSLDLTMTLADYLNEMEYAVSCVIVALWHEHDEAEKLRKEIEDLRRVAEDSYQRVQFIQQHPEDADDVMLGVGIHWDTYFGEDKEQYYKSKDLNELEACLASKEFSFSSLAGTLLQYAKQGLSASFGKLNNWPDGRTVGSQHLKTIILESRNQSEHWEEGNPRLNVEQCFNTLAAEYGSEFGQYKTKNLAFEVVSMLGWRSYADFKNDLLSM